MATGTKSANINSATGRNPVIAAPRAAPMIACSEIGVSRFEKPGRYFKDTAGFAHIFAKKDYIFIGAHLISQRLTNSFAIGHHGHSDCVLVSIDRQR
jgi:hypothetical protein